MKLKKGDIRRARLLAEAKKLMDENGGTWPPIRLLTARAQIPSNSTTLYDIRHLVKTGQLVAAGNVYGRKIYGFPAEEVSK